MANPVQKEGTFSWHELMTGDVEGAKIFYGALLGWRFETTTDAGMPYTHAYIEGTTQPVAGMFARQYAMTESPEQIPPHWGSYIAVVDVDVRPTPGISRIRRVPSFRLSLTFQSDRLKTPKISPGSSGRSPRRF